MSRFIIVNGKVVEQIQNGFSVQAGRVLETTGYPLPRTWEDWISWQQNPFPTIVYLDQPYDIGAKVYFRPLVSVIATGVVTVEVRYSDDGITYSAWESATGLELFARYLQIRVTVVNTTGTPLINSLTIKLSTEVIEEAIEDIDTSTLTQIGGQAGHVNIPVNLNFASIKGVTITLQSVGSSYTVELLSKDDNINGPEIQIWNGTTRANAVLDAFVRGV